MNEMRDAARAYFVECGLSYDDIDRGAIECLRVFIVLQLQEFNKTPIGQETSMILAGIKKKEFMHDGTFKYAQTNVRGNYFERREAITFGDDGFIGFAGWASNDNAKPFVDAFLAWCDFMKKQKDASNERLQSAN